MSRTLIAAASVAFVAAFVAACGQEPAPAAPTAPTAPPTTPSTAPAPSAPAAEAKKDEGAHAPETHGMPGMSELFKSDGKDEKK